MKILKSRLLWNLIAFGATISLISLIVGISFTTVLACIILFAIGDVLSNLLIDYVLPAKPLCS